MDLCAPLLAIGLAVFLVAVVGHGIWALAAIILKALFGDHQTTTASLRRRCLWCGTVFLGRRPECPSCGLDSEGPVARELADLEITVARIQSLVDTGQLDSALGEQVYKSLEARQSQLLKGVAQPVPAFLPETGPILD